MTLLICFIFGTILYNFCSAEELIITPEGEILHSQGTSFVLTCKAPPNYKNVDFKLKWFDKYNNEITTTVGSIYIEKLDEQTLKLYFEKISEQNGGYYKCEGLLEGTLMTKRVNVLLYKDITFDDAPTSQHPTEFTDALIICRVSGNPAPVISWRYRGMRIDTGGRYIIDPLEGLRIKNVTEADNGVYECRGENDQTGKVNKVDITVVIHRRPKITKELGTTKGVERQQVSITCKASGLPDPYYEFYRVNEDQTRSLVSDIKDIRFVDVNAGVIDFYALYRDDQAYYICRAINSAGSVESRGYLDVLIPPKIYEYRNTTPEENGQVKMICLTEGEPPPAMKFTKVGNTAPYRTGDNENGRIIVENPEANRLEMTIKRLQWQDTANYTCRADNEAGLAEQNGTVIVQHKPYFIADQPRIFYTWSGKTRNMTCETIANPEPVIEWFRAGKLIDRNNETFYVYPLIKNSVLQVRVREEEEFWIYSTYVCRPRNNYGFNELDFQLKRAYYPDAPGCKVIEETPTRLIFSVTRPAFDGGMPLLYYRIDYEAVSNIYVLDKLIAIEDLRPSTSYVFLVRAQNEVGVSEPCRLEQKTRHISIPYALQIISDPLGLYPYRYTILWDKPETGGNSIKEYKFQYRRVLYDITIHKITGYPEDWKFSLVTNEDFENPILSHTLVGLKPNTWYEVQITARNDIGWSDPNEFFVFKTSIEPEQSIIGDGNNKLAPSIGSILFCIVYLLLAFRDTY